MSRLAASALIGVLWFASAAAQGGPTPNTLNLAAGAKGSAARLADMRWLTGRWIGKGLGGDVEEVWTEAAAGAMMGMFRVVVDGKLSFYEFMTLVEENGTLALKLKHFNADLSGWEEKDRFVTFPLVKVGRNEAWFTGLTFRRVDDRLEIFLAVRSREGAVREERFTFRRATLP